MQLRRHIALCAAITCVAAASLARAQDAHAAPEASSSVTAGALMLILGVGVAYVLAHLVVGRMQQRFLVMSGVEYVVLGMLLGPVLAPSLRVFEDVDPVLPFVALGAGWVGLLRGMELRVSELGAAPAAGRRLEGAVRIAVVQSVTAGLLCGGAAYLFFGAVTLEGSTREEIATAAGVLGCAGAAAALEPLEVIARRYDVRGGLSAFVRRIAALSDLLAIVAFGVLVSVFHPIDPSAPASPRATEWVVIAVALGALLGLLFTPFLGGDDTEQGRFLALAGIITFASGAAYFLRIAPIFVTLCLGAVLINTARNGTQIRATLEGTRGPMALILLVFAGALVDPPPWIPAITVALGFVGLRLVGKVVGTWLATSGSDLRRDLHRGLQGQGDVTIAIAVAYRVFHRESDVAAIAFTAILVSRVFHDLLAPRALRGLLVDAGDIHAESAAPSAKAAAAGDGAGGK